MGFGIGDEACLKGIVMHAFEGYYSDFEAELVERFGVDVHA